MLCLLFILVPNNDLLFHKNKNSKVILITIDASAFSQILAINKHGGLCKDLNSLILIYFT